jgi:DHA2 family multidrug resistance protein
LATARRETLEDVRDTLISFGRIARKEYSTTVVGLFRMMMTQSTHSPLLKKRVFQAGPAAVTMQLRSFLSEASERGVLSIPDTQLYAEQLMGVLREPLYQALTLRPEISPDEPSIDHITAGIDLFLKGCANQGRTTP